MGSGFRTFQSGEVLTSSNVQNYLMDQSVMVFAGTAARSSAIASPETGMLTYRTDGTADSKREGFEFYDGSSYVRLIESGGLSLISSTTISAAATTNVNDVFSATYDNYKLVLNGTASTGTSAGVSLRLRVGGSDANTNYTYQRQFNSNNSLSADRDVVGTDEFIFCDTNATARFAVEAIIMGPFLSAETKILLQSLSDNNTLGLMQTNMSGVNTNATSYTGFTLISTGTLSGVLKIYGMKN